MCNRCVYVCTHVCCMHVCVVCVCVHASMCAWCVLASWYDNILTPIAHVHSNITEDKKQVVLS